MVKRRVQVGTGTPSRVEERSDRNNAGMATETSKGKALENNEAAPGAKKRGRRMRTRERSRKTADLFKGPVASIARRGKEETTKKDHQATPTQQWDHSGCQSPRQGSLQQAV